MRGGADTRGSCVRSYFGSLPPNLHQNLHQNEHYRALMSDMSRSSPELRRVVTNRGRRHRIRIREEFSQARVIVVTTFEGDYAIQRALTPALAH
jgi:hypothetical protein